ncbi:hypothetical protein ACWFRF_15360 [Nocardia sp. NPDC055165]
MSDNEVIRWTGNPSPFPPTRSQPPARWSTEGRTVSNIERTAREGAISAVNQAKLNMLRAELRKAEIQQIMMNTGEIMQTALNLAQGDPGKLDVFIEMTRSYAQIEMNIFKTNNNPLLKGML